MSLIELACFGIGDAPMQGIAQEWLGFDHDRADLTFFEPAFFLQYLEQPLEEYRRTPDPEQDYLEQMVEQEVEAAGGAPPPTPGPNWGPLQRAVGSGYDNGIRYRGRMAKMVADSIVSAANTDVTESATSAHSYDQPQKQKEQKQLLFS